MREEDDRPLKEFPGRALGHDLEERARFLSHVLLFLIHRVSMNVGHSIELREEMKTADCSEKIRIL